MNDEPTTLVLLGVLAALLWLLLLYRLSTRIARRDPLERTPGLCPHGWDLGSAWYRCAPCKKAELDEFLRDDDGANLPIPDFEIDDSPGDVLGGTTIAPYKANSEWMKRASEIEIGSVEVRDADQGIMEIRVPPGAETARVPWRDVAKKIRDFDVDPFLDTKTRHAKNGISSVRVEEIGGTSLVPVWSGSNPLDFIEYQGPRVRRVTIEGVLPAGFKDYDEANERITVLCLAELSALDSKSTWELASSQIGPGESPYVFKWIRRYEEILK